MEKKITIPNFSGEIHCGETMRILYATDASVYRELPMAVVLPRNHDDIGILINWANQNRISLIPRGAGTSLAGQVVGSGVVVDISKYFNKILEVDPVNRQARVEPGVVRNHLNSILKPHKLFFAPVTSTASRANLGGMIGNNSCGSNSPVYGSVRNHLLEVSGYLSDGSPVTFKKKTISEMEAYRKTSGQSSLEILIYKQLWELLSDPHHQKVIREHFPPPQVTRRNTGYALDFLLNTLISDPSNSLNSPCHLKEAKGLNLSHLVAGSEGTLMFITESLINLEPLVDTFQVVLAIHCHSVREALEVNSIVLDHHPFSSELIDDTILQCTKDNLSQKENRQFVVGDPPALLLVEFIGATNSYIQKKSSHLCHTLEAKGYRLQIPILYGEETRKAWELRAAGLGVMHTLPGDGKPHAVIEDAAVNPYHLLNFITDYDREMASLQVKSIYYGHAASGELHLRPVLNLKSEKGKKQFRQVAEIMVDLVKKYRGSLSGEHGDGRLRGEFIPQVMGDEVYQLFQKIKQIFDPNGIFNPGKIIDTPPMDTQHRYRFIQDPEIETIHDFSKEGGILRTTEMCNGTGVCRKGIESGGTMCPSYRALKNERETTRGRANVLREILTWGPRKYRGKKIMGRKFFDSQEIYEVMKFCLSCKGCKAECPSNIDMAKLKGEFLYQYYLTHGLPLSLRFITSLPQIWKLVTIIPGGISTYNLSIFFFSKMITYFLKYSSKRPLPRLTSLNLKKWHQKFFSSSLPQASFQSFPQNKGIVYFFADEFVLQEKNMVEVGKAAIRLLDKLGYRVLLPDLGESGRIAISKGFLLQGRKAIQNNLKKLTPLITKETPLVGIEPSTLLTFRDEAISLLRGEEAKNMKSLSKNILLLEEFLIQEIKKGKIDSTYFTSDPLKMVCHVHCHQKALSDPLLVKQVLTLPQNYQVEIIPSGCCGMAGSFGYEKENYDLSLQIGKVELFSWLKTRNKDDEIQNTVVVATGMSCREQIQHGMQYPSLHPAQILEKAIKNIDSPKT